MDHHTQPRRLARGSYWCSRANRFIEPHEAAYDRLEYEKLVKGPVERAGDPESGVFPLP